MRLRMLRLYKAYSIRGLAIRAKLAETTVRNVEEEINPPSLTTCRKLAGALGVEPVEIDECADVIDQLINA